jgi:hypothetical protein
MALDQLFGTPAHNEAGVSIASGGLTARCDVSSEESVLIHRVAIALCIIMTLAFGICCLYASMNLPHTEAHEHLAKRYRSISAATTEAGK